ncbi:MAG: MMPL family transporter [Bacteroidaceae bacterium]|nr:MMPL family transporter [Bacteroidaceae bacterium]
MSKIVLALYHFFEKNRVLMYALMLVSTLVFVYFGLKLEYEENIVKLLPKSQNAAASEMAFENLRVKDKIFIEFVGKEQVLLPEDLAVYSDDFFATLLEQDTATHYIDNVLQVIDDDMMVMALDYALTNVPAFVDAPCYAKFDSLLQRDVVAQQMVVNKSLVDNDEEGSTTTMVAQDPAALRLALLDTGKELLNGMGGYKIIDSHLYSPDSTTLVAFLSPNFNSFDSKAGTSLIDMLEENIEVFCEANPDVEILFHGAPVQSVFNSRQIKGDLLLTVGISLIIICIVIGWCFKNKSTMFMLLAPIIYGVFMALACMYWLKGDMSLMALGIGAIIMGVALSYCLHVLTHYKYMDDPVQIIKDQATPVFLGCLTTIGAFLGLLFTESELLQDFGLFASFAMMGTTFFALVFLPHFFKKGGSKRSEKAFAILDKINSYPIDRKRWLRIVVEVICVITLFTASWVTFDSDLRNIGYNEPKVIRSQQLYADKIYGNNASMYYAVAAEDLDEALFYNNALVETLDSLSQDSTIISYTKTTQLFIPTDVQEERIAMWREYWSEQRVAEVRQIIISTANANNLPAEMFAPFYAMIEADYEPASLYDAEVFPPELLSNYIEETNGKFMVFTSVQMKPEVKSVVNDAVAAVPHAIVIDPFYYTSDMVKILNDDFNTILGISSLFVFIILLLSFRSLPIALIAFMPMGLSWYVVQGIMGIFGVQFNLINIVIATFIFGIGVDYSIFVMKGLIAQASGSDQNLLTYHKTAIFFSAFVLIVVVGSLLFATHPAIKSIGVSTLIGMSATILLTYILEPALFRFMMRFKFFAKRINNEK